ncbi:hypothetical protein C8R44DRAFT_979612 [Mycena epipterygia]|nr:hypothetical protein C8R44DRAFT_979612 [Mycena epipterygia]
MAHDAAPVESTPEAQIPVQADVVAQKTSDYHVEKPDVPAVTAQPVETVASIVISGTDVERGSLTVDSGDVVVQYVRRCTLVPEQQQFSQYRYLTPGRTQPHCFKTYKKATVPAPSQQQTTNQPNFKPRPMHAFRFISVSAVFLLALAQGVVSQDEPVALGGTCETIVGTKPCKFFPLTLCFRALIDFWRFTGAVGKCCILNPDNGICMLKCPNEY